MAFSQITWGTKGGANVTTLGEFNSVYGPQLGYHVGFYYQQRLEQQYGIVTELHYSMQGARAKFISRQYLVYNYLNLPILLKIYFENNSYLEVGTQVGYLLFAKFHSDGDVGSITDDVKRFDFAAVAGGGMETSFGNYGARVALGLTNTSGATISSDIVFRNLVFQIYVAYTIRELE